MAEGGSLPDLVSTALQSRHDSERFFSILRDIERWMHSGCTRENAQCIYSCLVRLLPVGFLNDARNHTTSNSLKFAVWTSLLAAFLDSKCYLGMPLRSNDVAFCEISVQGATVFLIDILLQMNMITNQELFVSAVAKRIFSLHRREFACHNHAVRLLAFAKWIETNYTQIERPTIKQIVVRYLDSKELLVWISNKNPELVVRSNPYSSSSAKILRRMLKSTSVAKIIALLDPPGEGERSSDSHSNSADFICETTKQCERETNLIKKRKKKEKKPGHAVADKLGHLGFSPNGTECSSDICLKPTPSMESFPASSSLKPSDTDKKNLEEMDVEILYVETNGLQQENENLGGDVPGEESREDEDSEINGARQRTKGRNLWRKFPTLQFGVDIDSSSDEVEEPELHEQNDLTEILEKSMELNDELVCQSCQQRNSSPVLSVELTKEDTPKKKEDDVVRVVGKRNSGGRDASGVAVDSVASGLETRGIDEILTGSPSLRPNGSMIGEVGEWRSEEMVEEIEKEEEVGRRMSLRSTDLNTPKKKEDDVVRVVGKRNSGGRDASGVAVDSVASGLETRGIDEILTGSPSLRPNGSMIGEVGEWRSEEMVEEIEKEEEVGRRMSLRSTDLNTPKKKEDDVVRVVGKRNSGGRDASGVAVDSVASGLETRGIDEILTGSPSLRPNGSMIGEVGEWRSEEMVEEIEKEEEVGRRMSLRSTDLNTPKKKEDDVVRVVGKRNSGGRDASGVAVDSVASGLETRGIDEILTGSPSLRPNGSMIGEVGEWRSEEMVEEIEKEEEVGRRMSLRSTDLTPNDQISSVDIDNHFTNLASEVASGSNEENEAPPAKLQELQKLDSSLLEELEVWISNLADKSQMSLDAHDDDMYYFAYAWLLGASGTNTPKKKEDDVVRVVGKRNSGGRDASGVAVDSVASGLETRGIDEILTGSPSLRPNGSMIGEVGEWRSEEMVEEIEKEEEVGRRMSLRSTDLNTPKKKEDDVVRVVGKRNSGGRDASGVAVDSVASGLETRGIDEILTGSPSLRPNGSMIGEVGEWRSEEMVEEIEKEEEVGRRMSLRSTDLNTPKKKEDDVVRVVGKRNSGGRDASGVAVDSVASGLETRGIDEILTGSPSLRPNGSMIGEVGEWRSEEMVEEIEKEEEVGRRMSLRSTDLNTPKKKEDDVVRVVGKRNSGGRDASGVAVDSVASGLETRGIDEILTGSPSLRPNGSMIGEVGEWRSEEMVEEIEKEEEVGRRMSLRSTDLNTPKKKEDDVVRVVGKRNSGGRDASGVAVDSVASGLETRGIDEILTGSPSLRPNGSMIGEVGEWRSEEMVEEIEKEEEVGRRMSLRSTDLNTPKKKEDDVVRVVGKRNSGGRDASGVAVDSVASGLETRGIDEILTGSPSLRPNGSMIGEVGEWRSEEMVEEIEKEEEVGRRMSLRSTDLNTPKKKEDDVVRVVGKRNSGGRDASGVAVDSVASGLETRGIDEILTGSPSLRPNGSMIGEVGEWRSEEMVEEIEKEEEVGRRMSLRSTDLNTPKKKEDDVVRVVGKRNSGGRDASGVAVDSVASGLETRGIDEILTGSPSLRPNGSMIGEVGEWRSEEMVEEIEKEEEVGRRMSLRSTDLNTPKKKEDDVVRVVGKRNSGGRDASGVAVDSVASGLETRGIDEILTGSPSLRPNGSMIGEVGEWRSEEMVEEIEKEEEVGRRMSLRSTDLNTPKKKEDDVVRVVGKRNSGGRDASGVAVDSVASGLETRGIDEILTGSPSLRPNGSMIGEVGEWRSEEMVEEIEKEEEVGRRMSLRSTDLNTPKKKEDDVVRVVGKRNSGGRDASGVAVDSVASGLETRGIDEILTGSPSLRPNGSMIGEVGEWRSEEMVEEIEKEEEVGRRMSLRSTDLNTPKKKEDDVVRVVGKRNSGGRDASGVAVDSVASGLETRGIDEILTGSPSLRPNGSMIGEVGEWRSEEMVEEIEKEEEVGRRMSLRSTDLTAQFKSSDNASPIFDQSFPLLECPVRSQSNFSGTGEVSAGNRTVIRRAVRRSEAGVAVSPKPVQENGPGRRWSLRSMGLATSRISSHPNEKATSKQNCGEPDSVSTAEMLTGTPSVRRLSRKTAGVKATESIKGRISGRRMIPRISDSGTSSDDGGNNRKRPPVSISHSPEADFSVSSGSISSSKRPRSSATRSPKQIEEACQGVLSEPRVASSDVKGNKDEENISGKGSTLTTFSPSSKSPPINTKLLNIPDNTPSESVADYSPGPNRPPAMSLVADIPITSNQMDKSTELESTPRSSPYFLRSSARRPSHLSPDYFK
ncbi:unnamed protein product [Calicophoron daubneyi]|uniref:Uncharacterized protein n=1 Tax=Calicophoron daubneyi TaxID=300641 RepID=A0AAV2TGI2_CALDB